MHGYGLLKCKEKRLIKGDAVREQIFSVLSLSFEEGRKDGKLWRN